MNKILLLRNMIIFFSTALYSMEQPTSSDNWKKVKQYLKKEAFFKGKIIKNEQKIYYFEEQLSNQLSIHHRFNPNPSSTISSMLSSKLTLTQNNKTVSSIKTRKKRGLKDDEFYISDIKTKERFQRKGFGSVLLNHTLSLFQEAGFTKASLDSVEEAVIFYQKKGFIEESKPSFKNPLYRYSKQL